MNLYFLVEGERTEKKVYRSWIRYVFPKFHEDYLKEMIREREQLHYTKKRPGCVAEKFYFEALIDRNRQTGHIPSFGSLIELFQGLDGSI